MAKDPVCGMTVKEEGLKSIHNGEIYYFCSGFCKNLFEKDPDKYLDLRISVAPTTEKERTIAYEEGQKWIIENDPACSCCVPNEFGSQNCVRIIL